MSTARAGASRIGRALGRAERGRLYQRPDDLLRAVLGGSELDELSPVLCGRVVEPPTISVDASFAVDRLDEMKLELRLLSRKILRVVRDAESDDLMHEKSLAKHREFGRVASACTARVQATLRGANLTNGVPPPWSTFLGVCHELLLEQRKEALEEQVVEEVRSCASKVERKASSIQGDELARAQVVYELFRPDFDKMLETWAREIDGDVVLVTRLVKEIAAAADYVQRRQP